MEPGNCSSTSRPNLISFFHVVALPFWYTQFRARDLRSGRTLVPLHQPASFGGLMTSYTCSDTSRVRHELVVNCGRLLEYSRR
uniref:Uncharacterized protein n=1 Tax=Salix viminalis TaxID=40686 RepID=A0A6N2LR35_SALVM